MRRTLLLAAVAAIGLGGCHRLGAMFGEGGPHHKPGLWEDTVVSDRTATPQVWRWCFDAASDRQVPVLPRAPQGLRARACSRFNVSHDSSGYVIDTACSFRAGGPAMTGHSVVSGDFSSQYTVTSTVTIAGASDPSRNGVHKVTHTWVYKGACPPDIGPGQVERPNGDVVDMAQLRRGGGMGGGEGGGQGSGGQAGPSAPESGGGPGRGGPSAGGGPSGGGAPGAGPPAGGGG